MAEIIIIFVIIFIHFIVLFLIPIYRNEYTYKKAEQTYQKYPEMRQFKNKIDYLNNQISQYRIAFKKNQNEINQLLKKSRYCGQIEKDTDRLKKVRELNNSLYFILDELIIKRTTLYKERNDFASSHNIRYY